MSFQSWTGVPLNDTNRSPVRRPAVYAGLTGSVGRQTRPSSAAGTTHASTLLTVGWTISSEGLPYVANRPAKMKKAIRRLTVGPPAITTTFFHQVIR